MLHVINLLVTWIQIITFDPIDGFCKFKDLNWLQKANKIFIKTDSCLPAFCQIKAISLSKRY